ncbi:TPA: ead/Ea22-like family protein [Escherichia coli]|nr:ead/Ea22-like family protein [Escherichia coli]EGF8465831.1 ead/Ea22-like family protein [Escherichia coli]EGH6646786.1 ead/Ea22-like family protein [Escherichia coli]HCQ4542315.1 ead/Ea22-like family protein [Escherichia coli]HCQ4551501.1 ead/Ea22-like family protein [Escherichia coli]
MSEINYQALREVAERAIPAMERLLMLPADDDLLSEQELKDYGVDIDALNAFKFLTGPETVLALLDERERNLQYIKSSDQENEEIALTVGKLRVELEETKSKLNEQREYYEGVISDGSKRIAELESDSQEQKLVEAIIVAIENEQERLFDEDYLMDSKECIDVIREEVKRWNDSRAAGIRIKGE